MEKMTPISSQVCNTTHNREIRKFTTFHPSLWGDFYLTYHLPSSPKHAYMKERVEVLREEVRKMIKNTKELSKKLDLVITLQRLGLDYYYENEIDEELHYIYDSKYDKNNLHIVSLRFYLLRKNGYDVSSDAFLNFKDKEGKFIKCDIRSMLTLYNAAYLRTRGDKVLDEAIIFTRSHLEDELENLESPLADEVSSALETPLFRRVRIFEARNYIPIYEKEATRNETILEFAKVNFNLLQLLYLEELKQTTLWWKDLNAKTNLGFVRDRLVETYFWVNGICFEPQYSYARIMTTKMVSFITIIDDMFDTYGTTAETELFAEAIYRMDESAADLLPDYMKNFYLYLLKTFDSFEEELGSEKCYRAFYLKECLKILVDVYSKEVKWRDEIYVPKTVKEHLEVSMVSIGVFHVACSTFVGMRDIITKEILDWVLTYPKLFKYYTTFFRLSNDIASTKREQAAHHVVSTIQCCMNEHGVTVHDACEMIKELIEETWKDMVKECFKPSKVVPHTVIDMARTGDYIYKHTDAFTFSATSKDMIKLLFVEPLAI